MEDIKSILRQSHRATCGAFEREITVPVRLKAATIQKLRSAGFQVIGTSHGDRSTSKIWFIRMGAAGL